MPLSSRFAPPGGGPSVSAALIGHVTNITPATLHLDVEKSVAQENQDGTALFRLGTLLKVPVEESFIFGTVRTIEQSTGSAHSFSVLLDLLGELSPAGFSRGVKLFPLPGSPVLRASAIDQEMVFAPKADDTVRLGTVFPTTEVPAAIKAETLLSKHFAVLGSTGTGKSSTVALMIHRLVEKYPNAHIVILDPHNEYASAFSTNGMHISTSDLALPYWLMNFEEHVELFVGRNIEGREAEIDILKRCLFVARKKSSATYSLSLIHI